MYIYVITNFAGDDRFTEFCAKRQAACLEVFTLSDGKPCTLIGVAREDHFSFVAMELMAFPDYDLFTSKVISVLDIKRRNPKSDEAISDFMQRVRHADLERIVGMVKLQ